VLVAGVRPGSCDAAAETSRVDEAGEFFSAYAVSPLDLFTWA
jgi:hypothetical protein